MIRSSFYFLLVVFLLNSTNGFSQDLPLPQSIQSPNSASLGVYGDMPVNYYTGTPNISLPLYSINDYGVPLNISLNYNATGVRVNNMPGWVGQNWSLQVGGVITRMVKGNCADELYVPESNNGLGDYSGYYHPISRNLVDVNNWDDPSYAWDLFSVSFPNSSNGNFHGRDYHPDVFTFNFMGHTGKFFLSENGEWKVSSDSNIRVTIHSAEFEYPFGETEVPFNDNANVATGTAPASKMIYRITLKDDQGITYTFGNTDDSVEYGIGMYSQETSRWTANSWYLTEVKDRFNKVIYTFNYERDDYIVSLYNYERRWLFSTQDNDPDFFGSSYDCFYTGGNNFHYGGDLISPVYLSSIDTKDGSIDFNRQKSNGRNYLTDPDIYRILNGVQQQNGQNAFISPSNQYFYYYLLPYQIDYNNIIPKLDNWQKLISITGLERGVSFDYNDVSTNSGTNDRLNLLGVSIDNMDYEFDYNDFGALPDLLSTKVDHWGYYDGSNWVVNYSNYSSHYASRTTHATNVKKGMLTKMTYPTKGWTEFEWEPHSYSAYVSDDKSNLIAVANTITGGVRIAKIKNKDGDGDEVVKEFKYIKGYDINNSSAVSSGVLENKPKHFWDNFILEDASNDSALTLKEDIFSTNPILPLSNYSGFHVAYSEVVEKFSNGGYNIYKYTSNSDPQYRDEFMSSSLNPVPSPFTNYNDKSMLRGKLKEQHIFNSSNVRLRKLIKEYSLNNTNYIKGIKIDGIGCNGTLGVGFLKVDYRKMYYFDFNLTKEKTTAIENGNELVTYSQYEWEDYPSTSQTSGDRFLQSKKTNTFGNENSSEEEYYTEDYTYVFEENSANNNNLVTQRNFTLIETDIQKNNQPISKARLEYGLFDGDILPERQRTLKQNGSFEDRMIIDAYTDDQLVSRYHTPNGIHVYNVYDNHRNLIFKVEGPYMVSLSFFNSQLSSIINGSLNFDETIQAQKNIIAHHSDHFITAYTHDPNVGVTSITDPRGETQYYSYDSNERLTRIKDNNGKVIKQFIYNLKQ